MKYTHAFSIATNLFYGENSMKFVSKITANKIKQFNASLAKQGC